MSRDDLLEKEIRKKKDAILLAITTHLSLQEYVDAQKFTRPSWTKTEKERCGACAFIHGGIMCLLLDWFVSPTMKGCNHFCRPP
ncbi:hypothetical protein ES703_108977 [subsurface metagenome]